MASPSRAANASYSAWSVWLGSVTAPLCGRRRKPKQGVEHAVDVLRCGEVVHDACPQVGLPSQAGGRKPARSIHLQGALQPILVRVEFGILHAAGHVAEA